MFTVCSKLDILGKTESQMFRCPNCNTIIAITDDTYCPQSCPSCTEEVPDVDLLCDTVVGRKLRALKHICETRFSDEVIDYYQEEVRQGHSYTDTSGTGYHLNDAEFDAMGCGRGIYPPPGKNCMH